MIEIENIILLAGLVFIYAPSVIINLVNFVILFFVVFVVFKLFDKFYSEFNETKKIFDEPKLEKFQDLHNDIRETLLRHLNNSQQFQDDLNNFMKEEKEKSSETI